MWFGCRLVITFFVSSSALCFAQPQTLTQQLQQEAPETLVRQARESGNIVRGAILFHQGNINCAKCHQPAAEKDRLAPDLSRLGKDVTDASLVESILDPSKVISKGYETLNVQTIDGRVLSGLVVLQDDNMVVLRDGQNLDKLHNIRRANIDQAQPGNVSTMPSKLADQLTGRQQFLDLLRYVIDVKERGPTRTASPIPSATKRELTSELNGLILIRQHNCAACHESKLIDSLPAAHHGPNLKWSAQRLNPQYLAQFIANPHQTKPGTNMPALMGHLNEAEKTEAAKAIVHFLVSIGGNEFQQSTHRGDDAAVSRGNEIFHSVGCVACHSPRDENAIEQALENSVAMGDLAGKFDLESLVAFLEDPHVARPGGRMPKMQLTHYEAVDLAEFLLQARDNSASTSAISGELDASLVNRGKKLFDQLNCARCHSGVMEPLPGTSSLTKLADAKVGEGCLSSNRGNWPHFELTEAEAADIKVALESELNPLDARQTIDFTLTSFRCTACHTRDNLGGVSQQRRDHFQTTNLNLGEQGRIPPTLTGVGAKLKSKWMRDVLVNGRSIRPYMKTRMPQYGEQNVGHLVELFQTTDKLPETNFSIVDDGREVRKTGLKIVGNHGLNCAACHTYQYKLSDTMPAVDLTEMAQRLKKNWFYQYMLAPQKFSPNTVMPSYWPGGIAIRPDIDGTPEEQIEAIWQYLLEGRQARAPAGVIREPLEIVVTDEAKMLRRQYPEIGKRGIGVGYPGGVNLAYDAQQMRLATIWKGKFVDPAAVWYGQGSGNVRAMGRTIQLAKGPELFDLTQPRITNNSRPTGHRFKGYSLDKQRRPTMRYKFGSIDVEDFFREDEDHSTGQTQLRRRIKLSSSKECDQLGFRLADGEQIKVESTDSFRIGNRLTIRLLSGQKAKLADDELLYLPLKFAPQQTREIVIEYLWE